MFVIYHALVRVKEILFDLLLQQCGGHNYIFDP